jgi:CBS domain-containing protein
VGLSPERSAPYPGLNREIRVHGVSDATDALNAARANDGDMRIQEIMTRDVITVAPETPLKDVARLLIANRISGVPVCGPNGAVLGVVSEVDILRKEEGISPELARPLAWLARRLDGELDKIGSHTARESMSAPALTVRPTQHVAEVARLMVDHSVNRLPVVSQDGLVGIVSRADLVRAFVRSDSEIEHEIRTDVLLRTMLLEPGEVHVAVENSVVRLRGHVRAKEDAEIVERCVRRVPGVLEVENGLRWGSAASSRDHLLDATV